MSRMFGLLTVAVLAALTLAVVVLSGTAGAASETISGQGVLYARGSGTAEVSGDGRVDIRGLGVGTVLVCGAERLEAQGDGRRFDLPGGCVRFVGWKGSIHAAGEDMTVRMEGSKIQFRAAGEGTAVLKGHGQFRTGHYTGQWTAEGVTIVLAPAG